MIGMRKGLVLIWKIWFVLWASFLVIVIGVFWTFPLALTDKTFPLAYKGIRLWAILVFYGSGLRLKVEGSKQLDKNRAYIFMSNHNSVMDIMTMAVLHPHHPLVFVGKEELAKLPIFGPIYKRICITVDRSNAKSRAHVFTAAKEKLSQGSSIVIFPEGGIADDRNIVLQNFKDGAFSIGIATQTPLVLYAFKNLKEIFPEPWAEGRPGTVHVKLIDVFETEALNSNDKKELKEQCFELLYEELKGD